MGKVKILEKINHINGVVQSGLTPETRKEILDITTHLPKHYNVRQRFYHVFHELLDEPKCGCCSKIVTFKRGYAKFCSNSCRTKQTTLDTAKRKELEKKEKLKDVDNFVECNVCGEPVKAIAAHISFKKDGLHDDWDLERYKKEFPDSPVVSKNTSKILSVLNSGENNAMHKNNSTEEMRKSVSPFGKEFYKKRGFTEKESEEKVKEFAKKALKDRVCAVSLDYFLKITDGDIIRATELQKERQNTFTLEKCITKYGKIKGTKVYKERQTKWSEKMLINFIEHGDGRSPQSKGASTLFTKLRERLNIQQPKREFFVADKDRKYGSGFSFDFKHNKKLIEYNGDYWHMNPNNYTENDFNKTKKKTAKQIWEYDEYKISLANNRGYEVFVIWEKNYKENPDLVFQQCLDFLNS